MSIFSLKSDREQRDYVTHRGQRFAIIRPTPISDLDDDKPDECDGGDECDLDYNADYSEPLEPQASEGSDSLMVTPTMFGVNVPCSLARLDSSTNSALVSSSSDGSAGVVVSGVACPYSLISRPDPRTQMSIMFEDGCFAESLRENDLYVLAENDTKCIIGRVSSGTAKIYSTSDGLMFSATPPNTSWWRDLEASIRRGDVTSAWIYIRGFSSRIETRLNRRVRVIESADLRNVSVCSFTPYDDKDKITIDRKSSAPTMPLSLADASARLRIARNSISEADKEWLCGLGIKGQRV